MQEQESHAGSSPVVVLDLAQSGINSRRLARTITATAPHLDGNCLIDLLRSMPRL